MFVDSCSFIFGKFVWLIGIVLVFFMCVMIGVLMVGIVLVNVGRLFEVVVLMMLMFFLMVKGILYNGFVGLFVFVVLVVVRVFLFRIIVIVFICLFIVLIWLRWDWIILWFDMLWLWIRVVNCVVLFCVRLDICFFCFFVLFC